MSEKNEPHILHDFMVMLTLGLALLNVGVIVVEVIDGHWMSALGLLPLTIGLSYFVYRETESRRKSS